MDRNEAIALWDEHTVAGISKPFTRHVDVIVDAILAAYKRGQSDGYAAALDLTQAFDRGRKAGIEDAIKAVPDSKWCSEKSFKDGIEWCRAETLRRLKEIEE